MIRPAWWDCRIHDHMWRIGVSPVRCAFCGKPLVPWRKRVAYRIWEWRWNL